MAEEKDIPILTIHADLPDVTLMARKVAALSEKNDFPITLHFRKGNSLIMDVVFDSLGLARCQWQNP